MTEMAADGASVEGLRLLCGDLVVKVEYRRAVVQVAVRGVERFPEDGAIRVEHFRRRRTRGGPGVIALATDST
ncbi:MAG: hypothetical protein OXI20_02880 [Rhodospirillales bacterium]|nr:hypothetical protein [Rhodospirillales bacterium]